MQRFSRSRSVPDSARDNSPAIAANLSPGTLIEFHYPTDNRIRVSTQFSRRRLLIRDVRDMLACPVEPQYFSRSPDLRRGPVLLTGYEWLREDTRSFYVSSMRSIMDVTAQIRVLQLGFYDPLEPVPPKLFGPLWTDSRAELDQLRRLMRRLSLIIAAKPNTQLVVGLFPVTSDTLPYSQAGMRVTPRNGDGGRP